jgi:hypothetical protein
MPQPTEIASPDQPMKVHTMAGHKHIALAAQCLESMVRYSAEPMHVVVHEDGSVTDEDKEQFFKSVPNASFVMKKDADGPMNEFLAKYPACRKLRDNLVFGLKIFDIQVLDSHENLAYTDCDILFLKPYTELFKMPPDPTSGGVFMYDPIQAYCMTPTQFRKTKGLKLADRVNGGLLYFRRSAFDWDLVEWFLTHDEFVIHPYWKEQTAWSVLAAATKCWMWNESQVRVIMSEEDFKDEKLVAAHFVSSFRHLMDKAPMGSVTELAPVPIRSHPGGYCTYAKFVSGELGLSLRRKGLNPIRRKLKDF